MSVNVVFHPSFGCLQLALRRVLRFLFARVMTRGHVKSESVAATKIVGNRKHDPKLSDKPKRFHGSVEFDPTRVGRDAGRIADEVSSHLSGLVGANVTVTLEIEAEIPNGARPKSVIPVEIEDFRKFIHVTCVVLQLRFALCIK